MLVTFAVLLLTACGGGGGNSSSSQGNTNATAYLSPTTISVSAFAPQPAPTAGFEISASGLSKNQEVYLILSYTDQAIINATFNPGTTLPAGVTIQLYPPASLGVGTYKDTITVQVCYDKTCTQPVKGSPLTVSVTYTVTDSTFAVTGLSPTSVYAGAQPFTMIVNGSTFTLQSMVLWNGTQQPTTFVNNLQLTAQISMADIATAGNASVSASDPENGTSNTVTFTINPSPLAITSLSPASINAGGPAFALTVVGTGFTSQSSVLWNGDPQTTNFISATQLTAQIPATDISTSGTAAVSVDDPMYATSKTQTFTINIPPLALNSVSPGTVTVGGPPYTLTALGTSFTGTSIVKWNGVALATSLVSSTELIAQISASDISTTGTVSVMVSDPNSLPGTTGTKTITIVQASIDAVTFRMNPSHTGAVTFASMSFPSNPTWSVNFVDPPSYALIVDGKVIVTVGIIGFKSEMYALDQTTGNTVWGPIMIDGFSDATYDNGRVFAVCASISSTSTMEAFDANTGALDWSTPVPSVGYSLVGAPTAANGIVYIGGNNNEGMLNALDESTGTLLWSQPVQYGDNSTPSLTADGLYVSYPCQTYDFRPATGETIWHNNTGCATSGGGTPAVANQLLYSPDWQSGDTGDVFNAETGASEGTYTTNSMPAFTTSMGYFLQNSTLVGITLADNTVQWSFTGDGQLIGAPIVVNQYVFIGSSSGNLYALDGTTGAQVWNVNLGAAIGSNVYSVPFTGLAAGDGLLVVPAGTTLTAYTLSTNP